MNVVARSYVGAQDLFFQAELLREAVVVNIRTGQESEYLTTLVLKDKQGKEHLITIKQAE